MTAPATARLLEALRAGGDDARFVGGCVRDSLLGRDIHDIDIATDAVPERVVALLEAARIKAVPTGIEHGTVTAVVDGRGFEITTLRRDIATDGRHATVAFGTDWRVDAARRDFTINAMSLSPDGTLFDPFGGEADLAAGRLRFVGEAARRIEEDFLRILRWFRFYAHYGAPPPDAEALDACRRYAHRLRDLSGERIRHEMLRLLAAPAPVESIELMQKTGVFAELFGHAGDVDRLAGLCRIEPRTHTPPDPLLRLAALLGRAAVPDPLADRWRLSKAERTRLAGALRQSPALDRNASRHERQALYYRAGAGEIRDRVLLAWAETPETDAWRPWLAELETYERPRFPITGKDVAALGIEEGPRIGAYLERIEAWWIAEGFEADRTACLERLRNCLAPS